MAMFYILFAWSYQPCLSAMIQCFSLTTKQDQPAYKPQKRSSEQGCFVSHLMPPVVLEPCQLPLARCGTGILPSCLYPSPRHSIMASILDCYLAAWIWPTSNHGTNEMLWCWISDVLDLFRKRLVSIDYASIYIRNWQICFWKGTGVSSYGKGRR